MKYKYKVNGLDCANCTQKLEDSLNKKEEINDCVISFATGMMTFESEYDIDDHELLSFMQSIEDEVTIENLLSNITHHEEHKHDHEHEHHDECGCHHEHDHDCCGHEHHHHNHECGCGHHHEHVEDHRQTLTAAGLGQERPYQRLGGGTGFVRHVDGLPHAKLGVAAAEHLEVGAEHILGVAAGQVGARFKHLLSVGGNVLARQRGQRLGSGLILRGRGGGAEHQRVGNDR